MSCPQTVTFSYSTWVQRYPEFANVSEPLAQLYFDEATVYCHNQVGCPVGTLGLLTTFLNMLTAHVAALNAPQVNGQANDGAGSLPGSPLVGRVTNATEGSVTVAADMPEQPGSAAWFQQTKYGAAYWAATMAYRTMRYVPGPAARPANPGYGLGVPGGYGNGYYGWRR
jgi:hypothetical protein